MTTGYQTNSLQAYALITVAGAGPVQIDASRIQITHQVNKIPQARISVPLGRNASTSAVAAIHTILPSLITTTPVEIWLQVTLGPNSFGKPFETWPAGFFRVFRGRLAHTEFSCSRESAEVSLELTMNHWLGDLNAASMLSSSTANCISPAQFSTFAALQAGLRDKPSWSPFTAPDRFFSPIGLAVDAWAGVALNGPPVSGFGAWLQLLSKQDVLALGGVPSPFLQAAIAAALNSFEPFTGGYVRGVPLPMTLPAVAANDIAAGISKQVAAKSFVESAQQTLWDKLIELAIAFNLAVIPLIETALVVPLTPGLQTAYTTIYGQEYSAARVEHVTPYPKSGWRLFGSASTDVGAVGQQRGAAGLTQAMIGAFDNPNLPIGQFVYEDAPAWLTAAIAPSRSGRDAGVNPASVNRPGQGVAPAAVSPVTLNPLLRLLGNAYANMRYTTALLSNRAASLTGKLRLDIGVGTTVAVRCIEDKFVNLALLGALNGETLFAEVSGVTLIVDSEQPAAATQFELSNVRTGYENTLVGTSLAANPLYSRGWNGAPLSENAAFTLANNPSALVFGP